MRGSGAMEADQGVAVAAFVVEGQGEAERRPSVALGHGHRPGRQHGGEGLGQRGRQALRQAGGGGGAGAGAGAGPRGSRYGGSRKTRSYWAPSRRAAPRKRRASARRTSA